MIGLAFDNNKPDDRNMIQSWFRDGWVQEPTFLFRFAHPALFSAGITRNEFLSSHSDSA